MSSTTKLHYTDYLDKLHKYRKGDKVLVTFNPSEIDILTTLTDNDLMEFANFSTSAWDLEPVNKYIGFAPLTIPSKNKDEAYKMLNTKRYDGSINYIHSFIEEGVGSPDDVFCLPGRMTIRFKDNITETQAEGYFLDNGLVKVQKHYTRGSSVQSQAVPKSLYYTVRLPASQDSEENRLFEGLRKANTNVSSSSSIVQFAEPDNVGFNEALISIPPSDPSYFDQWGLNNSTTKDIGAPQAWALTEGVDKVVMAFVDSGIDTAHGDLSAKIIEPYNAIDGSSNAQDDSTYHGTNVASVAGAKADNGVGIAGVAPGCKIMPVKVDLVAGTWSQRISAINRVRDRAINYNDNTGVDAKRYVMCLAWNTATESNGIRDAIYDAYNNNVVVVCAAGDTNKNLNSNSVWPAQYCYDTPQHVITVGAHKSDGTKGTNTNFSNSAANGGMVVFAPGEGTLTYDVGNSTPVTRNGTSMAAAFVTGEAALVWSRHYSKNNTFAAFNNVNVMTRVMGNLNNTGLGFGRGRCDASLACNF